MTESEETLIHVCLCARARVDTGVSFLKSAQSEDARSARGSPRALLGVSSLVYHHGVKPVISLQRLNESNKKRKYDISIETRF